MDARRAYDEWHAELDVDVHASSPWYVMIKEEIGDGGLGRVLDIGCGRGEMTSWLTTRADHVVGIDFSGVAVRTAVSWSGARSFCVGDIGAVPTDDGAFSTVLSCETVEHVPDGRRAVSELARVLEPGGRLYLTTPNYLSTIGLYRVYLRLVGRRFTEVGQPINKVTSIPRVRRWLRSAGLEVEAVRTVGHYVPWPGRRPHRLHGLDSIGMVRWFGHHTLYIARKPMP